MTPQEKAAQEMTTQEIASICKALSAPNRLEIVMMLLEGEKCGCRILERFEIRQSTLSHHMKTLVECGLVNDRKDGKWHFYSLNKETLGSYMDFIEMLTNTACSPSVGCCINK